MITKRVVRACPEVGMCERRIYAIPESWCENREMRKKDDYSKISEEFSDLNNQVEKQLLEKYSYPIYRKGEVEWGHAFALTLSDNSGFQYRGSPTIEAMVRLFSVDGEDYSHQMFKKYLLKLGFYEHEAKYAAKRKNAFAHINS